MNPIRRLSRARNVLGATLIAAAAATLIFVTPVLAHLALVSSSPAAGSEIERAPDAVRLRFSQGVQLPLSEITVTGPGGALHLGTLGRHADSAEVLLAPLPPALPAGTYVVRWRVAGADGHPINGEFGFRITGAGTTAAPLESSTGVGAPLDAQNADSVVAAGSRTGSRSGSAAFAATRWLTFASLLTLLGTLFFRAAVLPATLRRWDSSAASSGEAVASGAAKLGAAAAWVLLAAAAARIYLQGAALGIEVGEIERIRAMLLETTWGWGWLLQVLGTALALIGLVAMRRGGSAVPFAAGVLAAAASPALSGHAAASGTLTTLAVAADWVHVIGAGGWVGTLLVLVAVGLPGVRNFPRDDRAPAARALVTSFSPVALGCATAIVATGTFAAWLHIGTVSGLWTTAYGRTLLVKLAFLVPVLAAGAYNWRRATPALREHTSVRTLRRSATLELAAAFFVLVATAVLVATPPPPEVPTAIPALLP